MTGGGNIATRQCEKDVASYTVITICLNHMATGLMSNVSFFFKFSSGSQNSVTYLVKNIAIFDVEAQSWHL